MPSWQIRTTHNTLVQLHQHKHTTKCHGFVDTKTCWLNGGGPPVNQRARNPVRWRIPSAVCALKPLFYPSIIFRWKGGPTTTTLKIPLCTNKNTMCKCVGRQRKYNKFSIIYNKQIALYFFIKHVQLNLWYFL